MPFTAIAAGVGLGISAIGTGASVYSQIQQGETQARIAEYNAQVQKNEADRLDMERRENLKRQRERNRRMVERQRGIIAKSGFEEEGGALSALADSAALLELEALDADRAARIRSNNLNQQVGLTLLQGQSLQSASNLSAAASGISGAGRLAGSSFSLLNSGAI